MSSNRVKIFLIILCISFTGISGQDVTQPESPVLEYLTVNPINGVATLTWSPSASPDVTRYVIYAFVNSTAFAIDTINDPLTLTYTDYSSQARYKSVAYVLAAMDAAKNISPLSNSLKTIFHVAQTDTCNNRIILEWTACTNKSHPASGYSINCSVDGAPSVAVDSVNIDVLSYIINGYVPESEYCFYITSFAEEGSISGSNRSCTITGIQKPPAWSELSALRVVPSGITLSGTYDPDGEITSFIAEKKEKSTGIWQQVDSGTGSGGFIEMADNNADTSEICLYRIAAVNNCSTKVTISKPVRNICLHSLREGNEIILKWNNPFPDESAHFRLMRDIGSGYEEVATALADTTYIDDYSLFGKSVKSGLIVYRIIANRSDNPSAGAESFSSAAREKAPENIMAANAFTPDGDGRNDSFAPALSFTPLSYEFTVMNRLGVVIFRTKTPAEGWDGYSGGRKMAAGTYLWTLILKTPSGATEKRNGTIAVLP